MLRRTTPCQVTTDGLRSAVEELEAYLARQPEAEARRAGPGRAGAIVGSPDEVAERYAQLLGTGIDGVTVNAPANGHVGGRLPAP